MPTPAQAYPIARRRALFARQRARWAEAVGLGNQVCEAAALDALRRMRTAIACRHAMRDVPRARKRARFATIAVTPKF